VENTYRGLVLGLCPLNLPQSFMGLEFVQGSQFSSRPLYFDTLDKFQALYPAHCGPSKFRLYTPGHCSRVSNLVSYLFRDIHR
jgi:hypothetical protein